MFIMSTAGIMFQKSSSRRRWFPMQTHTYIAHTTRLYISPRVRVVTSTRTKQRTRNVWRWIIVVRPYGYNNRSFKIIMVASHFGYHVGVERANPKAVARLSRRTVRAYALKRHIARARETRVHFPTPAAVFDENINNPNRVRKQTATV